MWSLIPFFAELWKTEHRPIGSELGNGMFQFQFTKEEDLLAVLEKRPYHFAKWMVIIQRWEPTVSESFPSLIPFWIKIQGVPIHLWSEATARSLGEDIGGFEKAEVTALSMRMQVQINRRLPLITTSVIEYSNGDEVTATFVYEKLERHCSKCLRLDHDISDCLVAKHEAKARKTLEEDEKLPMGVEQRHGGRDKTSRETEIFRFSATNPHHLDRQRNTRYKSYDPHYDARTTIDSQRRSRSLHEANHRRSREPAEDQQRSNYTRDTHRRDEFGYHRRDNYSRSPQRSDNNRRNLSSSAHNNPPQNPRESEMNKREESSSTKKTGEKDARGNPLHLEQHSTPHGAFNEALEEVREVMVQYTQCADPTESTARKERLRRAEEEGQLEEAAARMVQAGLGDKPEDNQRLEENPSAERMLIALRLGPVASPVGTLEQINTTEKRKPVRPPGKRRIQSSPKLIRGASARKRKIQPPKNTQAGQYRNPEIPLRKKSKARAGTSRESRSKSDSATNSEDQPICNMIPAAARRRMDFQNPSFLGP